MHTHLPSPNFAVACLRCALGLGAIASVMVRAQTGSAPVGVMSYAAAENSTISLGVPLLRPAVATGTVSAVTGAKVTLTGPAAGSVLPLVAGESYFLEVIGHVDGVTTTLVGQRFEVDEAGTLADAGGALSVDTTSLHNTAAASTLVGLVNYRVTVRPHWTLAALLGTGARAKVNAAVSAASADQVLAWNGVGFSVYYVRSGEVPQWRNTATGAASQDGAILPPGVGLFLRRQAGELKFAVPGEVRTTAFVRPPFAGSQIIAGGFPVDASPADLKLAASAGQAPSAGLTAGTAPSNADQLLAWDATAFSVYYLRAGQVPQWRNVATGLLDYSTTAILPARGASLLLLRAPVAGAGLPQMTPFSL
jgi:uncharacterized protein (TIGR02597 family)